MSSFGLVGVHGDDVEMGIRKDEEPTEVPVEPGGGTLQGGNPSDEHPLMRKRGQRDFAVFWLPTPLTGGVPWG